MRPESGHIEWPTLFVLVATYVVWALATTVAHVLHPMLGFALATLTVAQFSSLQHEVLHGHPFANQRLNEALVFAGITLYVPYNRFRDTHLAHHHDPILTDPYDDPESNFMDPAVWVKTPGWLRLIRQANNTLLGRILIGPALSIWYFGGDDLRAILNGDRAIRAAWLLHAGGLAMVLAWFWATAGMPFWVYAVAAYLGYGILKIRTYLEHRAHDAPRARSVVVEDRGLLAFLFLNNNYHAVHHSHPGMAWYRLPGHYAANQEHFLRRNEGYVYRNYAQIFRKHLLRAKDPVPHPAFPVAKGGTDAPIG